MFQKWVTTKHFKFSVILIIVALVSIAALLLQHRAQTQTVISTGELSNANSGRVISGSNDSTKRSQLATKSHLIFESEELATNSETANAAILSWDQDDDDHIDDHADDTHTHSKSIEPKVRTFNGGEWSDWVYVASLEDRKDNTALTYDALILADKIEKLQYRFEISADEEHDLSPSLNIEDIRVETVDTSRGPSPTQAKSVLQRIQNVFKSIGGTVHAKADGPQIFSRADWGSPEPNSSPRWRPEYTPLVQSIVHHTATTQTPDSAAALRAIWHYHANSRGWGDIGYNYIVDHGGNIFKGRYSDPIDEWRNGGEVVGGHAYGNNRNTTGVAVLGNFTNIAPNDRMIKSVAQISAFKMHRFEINPAHNGARGPNLLGHRDVGSTACPGAHLYNQLQNVRINAYTYYNTYLQQARYDLSYRGQGVDATATNSLSLFPGEQKQVYIDLKNEGTRAWRSTGANPTTLGTDFVRDRRSPFAANSWKLNNRPTTFNQKVVQTGDGLSLEPTTVIQPGEVGRFTFIFRAPAGPGQYREYFHLLNEGQLWFPRTLGIYFNINVRRPTYTAQFVSQNMYTSANMQTTVDADNINPGQRFYYVIRLRNSGNRPWSSGGVYPVRIATGWPNDRQSRFCDQTWLSCNRPATFLETGEVNPGQVATFGFWINVPANMPDGLYREYVIPVADQITWMNDLGIHAQFKVRR